MYLVMLHHTYTKQSILQSRPEQKMDIAKTGVFHLHNFSSQIFILCTSKPTLAIHHSHATYQKPKYPSAKSSEIKVGTDSSSYFHPAKNHARTKCYCHFQHSYEQNFETKPSPGNPAATHHATIGKAFEH